MLHKKFLLNAEMKNASENDALQGTVIYEVIRILQNKPLFLKEHLQRLQNSASLVLTYQPSHKKIIEGICSVIKSNDLSFGNIEIQINNEQQLLIKIIPHSYPTESMYEKGVCLGLLQAERQNPNAKEKNQTLRERANILMKEKNFFEVLLVDNEGFITEGSRSNVFFIKNHEIYTSPTKTVLQGITREKIFEICHQQNITIIEIPIPLDEITSFNAVFMTGTSPAVLPIQKIEQYSFFPKNTLSEKIKDFYNQLVKNDIENFNWQNATTLLTQ